MIARSTGFMREEAWAALQRVREAVSLILSGDWRNGDGHVEFRGVLDRESVPTGPFCWWNLDGEILLSCLWARNGRGLSSVLLGDVAANKDLGWCGEVNDLRLDLDGDQRRQLRTWLREECDLQHPETAIVWAADLWAAASTVGDTHEEEARQRLVGIIRKHLDAGRVSTARVRKLTEVDRSVLGY